MNESILAAVHATVQGLHEAGVMKLETMRAFDALCLPTVKTLTPAQIKKIRLKSGVSQAVFAAYPNTPVSTIQKWEQGQKKPRGLSLKLLHVVAARGLEVLT